MALTYGLRSPRELLEKLKRDATLLGQGVTSDRFFNFVVTGYSMIDWVKNDASMSQPARSAVSNLYADPSIKVCRDLANASKHFTLDTSKRKPKPITVSADSRLGEREATKWGSFPWGVEPHTHIEQAEYIQINLEDGSSFPCLELVNKVIEIWNNFFRTHQL